MSAISSTKLVEEPGRGKDLPIDERFQNVFEQELKNLEEFKKNAPGNLQQKIEKFEKHSIQLDNALCELLRNITILFCVLPMISAQDPEISNFPALSISLLRQFFEDKVFDSHASKHSMSVNRFDTHYPNLCIAIANIAEHTLNHKLERHVFDYFEKLPRVERVFISSFKKIKQICRNRIDEYKQIAFENTDHFQNMKTLNEANRKRIKEIGVDYKVIMENFASHKQAYKDEMKFIDFEVHLGREFQEMKLQNIRIQNKALVDKMTRSLHEQRTNRTQTAENIEDVYQQTLQTDLKRCKTLRETRFKREMAVMKMIEKFDRDYSVEYNRREELNAKYKQLIEKSQKLEDPISALTTENFFILNEVETKKEVLLNKIRTRNAIIIQRWWHSILELRRADNLSEGFLKSRNFKQSVHSSVQSKGVTPKISVRLTKNESEKSSHNRSKQIVKTNRKPYVSTSPDIGISLIDSSKPLSEPMNPKFPEALIPQIDRKKFVSIASEITEHSTPKKHKSKKRSRTKKKT